MPVKKILEMFTHRGHKELTRIGPHKPRPVVRAVNNYKKRELFKGVINRIYNVAAKCDECDNEYCVCGNFKNVRSLIDYIAKATEEYEDEYV